MIVETLIYIWHLKNNVMNGFEPTILGISVYIITIAQINEYLQGLLIVATLVYTVIKITQLLKKIKYGKNI